MQLYTIFLNCTANIYFLSAEAVEVLYISAAESAIYLRYICIR